MKKLTLLFALLISAMIINAETFIKVTDPATLQDGDQIVMGYETGTKVSDGFSSTKKFIAVTDATFSDGQVTLSEPTTITLRKSGSLWKLYIGTKPIGHKSGNNDLDANQNTTTEFAITIDNGNAKLISQTPGKNNNEVFFAYNASSPRFALYHAGSNMKAISIYLLDETTIPDVVVEEVTLSEEALSIRIGETATLTASVLPEDAVDKTIEWGSTDASVASVADGVVTAVAEGKAKIWVKATAVNISDTCEVTVLSAWDNTTVTYNALKDPALLTDGAKVFIGTSKEGEDYIMGIYDAEISKNNIKGVPATYGENRHTVTAEQSYAYTVQRDGENIIFIDQDGNYLRPISDSKLRSDITLDKQSKWTISEINQDDATVEMKNAYYTSRALYNNYQGTNDLFNLYQGYDASYLAKTILYASTAPEWEDRVLDSWIQVSTTTLDWGQQEPDEVYQDWADSRKFTISFNDLTDDITIALTGDAAFYCGTETIKKDANNPIEITVFWQTETKGVDEGQLTISTATEGVEDIVINLRAEAVAAGSVPDPDQPAFSVSTNSLNFNLSPTNDYSDLQMFTFSASNLQKTLFCKWEHPGSILFHYEYLNACMEILADDYTMEVNNSVSFPVGYDYEDVEVYVAIDDLKEVGTYSTKLHFYSYQAESKEELAIDEYVTINTTVMATPSAVDNIPASEQAEKTLHNGQLIILRDGKRYNVMGAEIRR